MYAGRVGYGGQLPYGIGERVPQVTTNLAGVSESGYGPYLGNFFDDLQKIAQKVGVASGELSKVASGEAKIGTFPTDRASLIIPVGGSPVATSIPLVPLVIGAGLLLWFGLRKR